MPAHDLSNPLSAISAYSKLLLSETEEILDTEHYEFLEIIQNSSDFMLNLVNDLLDVSKIEAGKLNLNKESTDVRSMIERNVSINQMLANRKNIKIKLSYTNDIPLKN